MLIRGLGIVLVALLCFWGCKQGVDDRQVEELFAQQQEHSQKISQMTEKMDAIDEKLAAIEGSLEALLAAGGATGPGKGKEAIVASTFASTEEYKDIMGQIALLHEQVGVVQEEFVKFREEESQNRNRQALRDRGSAFRAMSQPEEMSRRMDILAKNFSGRIQDPASRDQFVADVENLKAKYTAALSPEQKREEARALITEAMNAAGDDRGREFMERQLRSLDEAGDSQELADRVDRVLQFQRMREISDLARKYNIPGDVVRDSGLMYFDRGGGPPGSPGFGPRRGR